MTEVSVVVVTYNAPDWVVRCLASLERESADGPVDIEVVVVDNASDPPTRRIVANSGFRTVLLAENVGFGRACNRGVAATTGRLVLLLNPDTEVSAGAVAALASFHDAEESVGVVGGRTLTPDGRVDPRSCWGAITLWSLLCFATGLTSLRRGHPWWDPESLGRWTDGEPRQVPVVSGGLMLLSRELWERLGGFDEDFFMYGEDADLCRRARELGYRAAVTPSAVVMHGVGASSGSGVARRRMVMTGRATVVRKQWRGWRRGVGTTLLVLGTGGRALAARGQGDWAVLWRERRAWSQGWPPYRPADRRATSGVRA